MRDILNALARNYGDVFQGISRRGSRLPVIEPGEEVIEGAAGEISAEKA